jgi:hypothetical protein
MTRSAAPGLLKDGVVFTLAMFLRVFPTNFAVLIPFIPFTDVAQVLRVSNAFAMLFLAGSGCRLPAAVACKRPPGGGPWASIPHFISMR